MFKIEAAHPVSNREFNTREAAERIAVAFDIPANKIISTGEDDQ